MKKQSMLAILVGSSIVVTGAVISTAVLISNISNNKNFPVIKEEINNKFLNNVTEEFKPATKNPKEIYGFSFDEKNEANFKYSTQFFVENVLGLEKPVENKDGFFESQTFDVYEKTQVDGKDVFTLKNAGLENKLNSIFEFENNYDGYNIKIKNIVLNHQNQQLVLNLFFDGENNNYDFDEYQDSEGNWHETSVISDNFSSFDESNANIFNDFISYQPNKFNIENLNSDISKVWVVVGGINYYGSGSGPYTFNYLNSQMTMKITKDTSIEITSDLDTSFTSTINWDLINIINSESHDKPDFGNPQPKIYNQYKKYVADDFVKAVNEGANPNKFFYFENTTEVEYSVTKLVEKVDDAHIKVTVEGKDIKNDEYVGQKDITIYIYIPPESSKLNA